jgi:HD-GYP domain-containing protein (c-di-GMP phosphodiesterase class II)
VATDRAALTRLRGEPLLEALDGHVPGAQDHADATAAYALAIAVEVGLDREQSELIRETARLHEVGKLYIPPATLTKPAGELSREETERLASHHADGQTLALGAGVPAEACAWILHSRERFDGRGPDGLTGEGIPIASRILRVACTYETLLPEQPAASAAEARHATLAWLRAAGGAELDPDVVEALGNVVQRVAADR